MTPVDYARIHALSLLMAAFAAIILALAVLIFVLWAFLSVPNAKLFEADNIVCFSQPMQMQCVKRGS